MYKEILNQYGLTQKDVFERLAQSGTPVKYNLVSKVINGKRADRHGIIEEVIKMAEEEKRRRSKIERKAETLLAAVAAA